jgi:hypothetical protein
MLGKIKTNVYLDMSHDIGLLKRPRSLLKKFKEAHGFDLNPSFYHPIIIKWAKCGFGFGEIALYVENGKIRCGNECMSKDFIKSVLCELVDKAVLNDRPPRRNKINKLMK